MKTFYSLFTIIFIVSLNVANAFYRETAKGETTETSTLQIKVLAQNNHLIVELPKNSKDFHIKAFNEDGILILDTPLSSIKSSFSVPVSSNKVYYSLFSENGEHKEGNLNFTHSIAYQGDE